MAIIAATIVSFVYAFAPNRNNSNSDLDSSGYNFGSVNGEPITREQLQAARQEARIIFRLNYGEWPDTEDKRKNLLNFAQQRVLLNAELEEFHITATPAAAARYARQFLGIKPEDVVPADKIVETLGKLGQEGGVSLDDFDRYFRHQVGQEYLISLVGMTGKLITPQEAEGFYRRENAPMETELVSFPASNFYAMTTTGVETNIEDFYTRMQADYRVPDRIQVNYVAFSASNYMDKVLKEQGTNLIQHIDQAYLQAGATAFKDEAGAQLSPEAAKAKIKKEMLAYGALSEAGKDAKSFLNELSQGHDDQHPYTPGDLATLAKAKKFTVRTTEPFELKNGTNELAILPKYVHVLFQLRDDDPDDKEHSSIYAPLVAGEDTVYVVGLQKRIPSQVQPLSAVHDKVVADYRKSKALELAKGAGTRFESALEAGLPQGKTFDTMCAAQFVHPQSLSPFSLTSTNIPEIPDRIQFEQVMEIASKMHPGQVSPFIPAPDGGFLLYIKGQLPVDEAALKSNLPAFLARMREQRQIAAFNAWFNKEYSLRFVPPPGERPASGG